MAHFAGELPFVPGRVVRATREAVRVDDPAEVGIDDAEVGRLPFGNRAAVQVGQKVAAGETVGTTGSGLEGSGLYFEVRFQGRPEDPLEWLKKEER